MTAPPPPVLLCPICGGSARLNTRGGHNWRFACEACRIGFRFTDIGQAIRAIANWNRQHPAAPGDVYPDSHYLGDG